MIIRKSKSSDLLSIIDVLEKYFHFKPIRLTDAKIDSEWGDNFSIMNSLVNIDLEHGFVAEEDGHIVGFSHYRKIDLVAAETTLLVVNPNYRSFGAGRLLQEARMNEAFEKGFKKFITYCAHPDSQTWYKKHFGYSCVGKSVVHHSIYAISSDNKILSVGLQYGFKEYPEQEILECEFVQRH